jgi:hypothetical protein
MELIKRNIPLIFSVVALVVSGCTSLGIQPLPNVYQDAETVSEKTLVTINSFEAVQETLIDTCSEVEPGSSEGDICVSLISYEQTLRPAVTASAQIAAEYTDINNRIEALGPEAPAEWLVVAGEAAGRLAVTFNPVREDVEEFIERAGNLIN